MSDAKARHFKPHGRFPFVTSIWWRLNNSAREQAQGAQPPHTTAWRRRTTGRAPVDVYHHLHHHRNTTTTTTRKLLPRFVTLTKLVPKGISLSLENFPPLTFLQPSLSPSFPRRSSRGTRQDLIRVAQSDLSNHPYSSLQRSSNPLLAFLSPPTSPTPTVPRDLDNTALASGCRWQPTTSLSLSFSFILSANDKLTLERGALSMPMRAIFKRGDFFERKIDLHIYIYVIGERKETDEKYRSYLRYLLPCSSIAVSRWNTWMGSVARMGGNKL